MRNKIVGIHQPETFPWAGYFSKMMNSDLFVIMDNVQYKKNNFQNRNRILMNNKPTWVSIPVDTKGRLSSTIADTKIADTVDWRTRAMHQIEVAYSKCSMYDELIPEIDYLVRFYNGDSLFEFNINFIHFIRHYLNIDTPIWYTSELELDSHKSDLVFDICKDCDATTYLSGEGGRDYLGLDRFNEANIEVLYQSFDTSITYNQNSDEFVPYMSVLDIIMNNSVEESLDYIKNAFSFVK